MWNIFVNLPEEIRIICIPYVAVISAVALVVSVIYGIVTTRNQETIVVTEDNLKL